MEMRGDEDVRGERAKVAIQRKRGSEQREKYLEIRKGRRENRLHMGNLQ